MLVQTNQRKPLDALSTDTIGSITPTDCRESRYLQLSVDAVSGLTIGKPIKTQFQDPALVVGQIRQLQTKIGTTTKRYHSDSAKELQSTALSKFLRNQGTILTPTAPTPHNRIHWSSVAFKLSSRQLEQLLPLLTYVNPTGPTPPRMRSISSFFVLPSVMTAHSPLSSTP